MRVKRVVQQGSGISGKEGIGSLARYNTSMSLFPMLVHAPEEFVCVTGKDVAQAGTQGGRCR